KEPSRRNIITNPNRLSCRPIQCIPNLLNLLRNLLWLASSEKIDSIPVRNEDPLFARVIGIHPTGASLVRYLVDTPLAGFISARVLRVIERPVFEQIEQVVHDHSSIAGLRILGVGLNRS